MSYRSRSRLAADWFAKLRENAVTGEVEQADVADSLNTLSSAVQNINVTTIDGDLTVNGAITATGNITAYN